MRQLSRNEVFRVFGAKSEIVFQTKLSDESKQKDFIVTDDNNTIIGTQKGGPP